MKPIIAVTLRSVDIKSLPSYFSNCSYLRALHTVGADYILIGGEHDVSFYRYIATMCHGLLLTGGKDINPIMYNESIHKSTTPELNEIDNGDFLVLKAFYEAKKPILGICRGAQAINVFFGGTLYQHLSDYDKFHCNHKQMISRNEGSHYITWQETIPNLCLDKNLLLVNSLHHQGIFKVAPKFKILGLSEDNLIEAIYKDNILAVQWHPEEMIHIKEHLSIFEYFISLTSQHL